MRQRGSVRRERVIVCQHDADTVVHVGLIGCGTVGGAFATALRQRRRAIAERYGVQLKLLETAVAHPDRQRSARAALEGVRVHGDGAQMAARPDLDVIVEASTAREAAEWLRAGLSRGAAVVTANKAAMAGDVALLGELIAPTSWLWCEAAVGGAVPIVAGMRRSLTGTNVVALRGLLNGTSSFVLSRVEDGLSFDDAVREAQRAGYAEADPTADLSGADAAAKLVILATVAWGRVVSQDDIIVRGITPTTLTEYRANAASSRPSAVRLVASASWSECRGRMRMFVTPELLRAEDPLFRAQGVEAVVAVETDLAGRLVWGGPGAGGAPTASALLADTIAAAQAVVRRRRGGDGDHRPKALSL
jgi:homoserine dehydrogenase